MVRESVKTRGPICTSPFTTGKVGSMRALPASWYTSPEMYELERRAIFTTKWLLITHEVRIQNPGDWVKFESAGYEFVLTRDRKGQINAFHNTCRHRAYPVVEEASGRNQILACKYHGWTYSLDGKLTKAPWYEDVQGFDKSKNSLFSIHTKVDVNGFVWVNLDSSPDPEPWEVEFENVDKQERFGIYNMKEYVFDHEFSIDAACNWKLCVDNFNECYHCPTAHPTIPTLLDVETLRSDSNHGWSMHTSAQSEEQKRDGLQICSTYHFPNVSTSILPHYIMLQRFLPTTSRKTTMHYQIFRNKNSSVELFNLINDLYTQVMHEDKVLAANVQKNMDRGLFVNGEMHPRVESAPLHHQAKTREMVKKHLAKEKEAGREIWPARQAENEDEVSREDEEICRGLACGPGQKEAVAW